MSHALIETDVELITNYLQANLPAELAAQSALRGDNAVPLPAPLNQSYFVYVPASGFRPPAIFIIGDNMDFRLAQKGANFIDSLNRINISVVVEAKDTKNLTLSTYRYQAALHKLLAQTRLQSADNKVTIVIKVVRATFSAHYTNAQRANDPQGTFRKEVLLECDVEHYESLTA